MDYSLLTRQSWGRAIANMLMNNIFFRVSVSLLAFSCSSYLYAGCGSGGVNPLAKIPNLAPSPVVQSATPKPLSSPEGEAKAVPVTPAAAPQPPSAVGKIVWVKGSIQAISPDKKVRDLTSNSVVFSHDVLVTKNGSQAQVVFSDHTMVTMSEKTTIYLNKYEFKPEVKSGSVGKFVMDLIEGGYRTITGLIAKNHPSDYKVNTEVATIGVRGTDYAVNIQACKLVMKNNHGVPFVQNEKGTLVLTKETPYASVELNRAPIVVKTEPAVFKNPLPIVPAKFIAPVQLPESVKTIGVDAVKPEAGGGGSGGGGKACGLPGSSGEMTVKYR